MEREANSLSLSSRYLVLESIGAGGMGVVVKAHDCVLKIDVAIKMLGIDPTGVGAARLQREATAAGRLSHPNIAKILDFGQWDDGKPYMVMEYLEGKSLSEYIKEEKHLSCKDAISIFIQIANGLYFAHNNKVVHRDLKPSNIILLELPENQHFAKIVDFGVARITDDHLELTQKGAVVGSPLYLSPEQAEGLEASTHSDIYSFGCLMFETLTGEPPFKGSSIFETLYLHKNVAAPLVTDLIAVQMVPRELVELVDECLRKIPHDRPADFELISDRLVEIKTNLQTTSFTSVKKEVVTKRPQRSFGQVLRSRAGLISLALIAVASSIFYFSLVQTQNDKIEKTKMEVKADSNLLLAGAGGSGQFKRKHFGELIVKYYAKEVMASSDQFSTDESLKKLSHEKVNTLKCDAGTFNGSGLKYLNRESLRSVSMAACQLDDEGLREFTQFPNLYSLKIGSNDITDKGVVYLRGSKLNTLKINSKKITGKVIESLIKMPNLTQITITSPNLDSNFINGLHKIKNLRDLEISGTPLLDRDFENIAKLSNLRVLHLGQTDLNPRSLRFLAGHPNLQTLDFSDSHNISIELIENVIPLKLDKLDLSRSNLTDVHLLKFV